MARYQADGEPLDYKIRLVTTIPNYGGRRWWFICPMSRDDGGPPRRMELAEEQGAFLLKLRAVTSLARLWLDHGKRDEARELLAPVYGWFTEGFDTLDLKEAKALLDELHA
jgi:hypothetical protein